MKKRKKNLPKPTNQPTNQNQNKPQPHPKKPTKPQLGKILISTGHNFPNDWWWGVLCAKTLSPTKLLPVLNSCYCWFLSVTFPISEFQPATRKNVYYFFYEADSIFSTIAHSCWGWVMLCQVHPMMSFPFFCAALFPFHSLCSKKRNHQSWIEKTCSHFSLMEQERMSPPLRRDSCRHSFH